MPANLPPQYYELEREYKKEQDPREKLRLAQELLAMMPKHKGTDKLQAELKAKISKLKEQLESGQKIHGARHLETHDHIDREGAGQAILIGPPNSGKSSLLASLTHAHPLITDYPLATREPLTGMMAFETVQIQLIDTPSIAPEHFENYLINLIRQADSVLLVVDLTSTDLEKEIAHIFNLLQEKRIRLCAEIPLVPDDPLFSCKRTLIVGHKMLEDNSAQGMDFLKKTYSSFPLIWSSILDDDSLGALRRAIFASLRIIRAYTKKIGQAAAIADPIVLPVGGTIEQAALTIHKDFARQLQFAKIWREGHFEGYKVSRTFVLADGDIVEFHI
ncbi:Small GTP-binding protein [Candidatus Zixiibacteriota bacterium]|nr:Small GTP-binding protein [candidate division Zixibacteria bacterium]